MTSTSFQGAIQASCTLLLLSGLLTAQTFAKDAHAMKGSVLLDPRGAETAFTYRGRRGPAFWAKLDSEWSKCAEGTSQSPIDVTGRQSESLPGIRFDYKPSPIRVLNNGHTVEFVYQAGSFLHLGERAFELIQFHFHTPSEHTFHGGAHFPVELHLVHKDESGAIAVVGIMLVEGERNRATFGGRLLGQMLPREPGMIHEFNETIDAGELLPEQLANYRYRGSLTTPPCSEQVHWVVLRDPAEMSANHLQELRQALNQLQFASGTGTNNRPTQPLNGRSVLFDGGVR